MPNQQKNDANRGFSLGMGFAFGCLFALVAVPLVLIFSCAMIGIGMHELREREYKPQPVEIPAIPEQPGEQDQP